MSGFRHPGHHGPLAAEADPRPQTNLIEKLLFDYCRQVGIDPVHVAYTLPERAYKKSNKA